MSSEKGRLEPAFGPVASKANTVCLALHTTDPVTSTVSFVILSGSIRQLVDELV